MTYKSQHMQNSTPNFSPQLNEAYDEVWVLRESGEYGDNLPTWKARLQLCKLQLAHRIDEGYYTGIEVNEDLRDAYDSNRTEIQQLTEQIAQHN